jgi:hypothetical protein
VTWKPLVSPVAAIGSVVAASSCCLPIGTFLIAAGFAGASRVLQSLQPYLLGLAVLMVIVGFAQTYGKSRCSRKRGAFSVVLLWFSAMFVLTMLLFPQAVASFLADRFPAR